MSIKHEENGLDRASAVKAAIKDCIKIGALAEYLGKYASEVANKLLQEWNWDEVKAVWQKEAEERADLKWQSVVADKDTIIAELRVQLGKGKLRLTASILRIGFL